MGLWSSLILGGVVVLTGGVCSARVEEFPHLKAGQMSGNEL